VKERRKVGEGYDIVTIEDTSDDEDEETLQERFQLRSRFSRPGLPNIPLIVERPASLEACIPAPPRRPRNVVRKRTAKNLKITESTNQEVSTATGVVEYFSDEDYALTIEFSSVTDIPSSDPVDHGEEETWDTVGGATERSIGPPPTTREVMPESAQQAASADNSQASTEERRPDSFPTTVAEQPEEAQADDEAVTEAGIVDITNILGAPTVTVVRSNL
jgi:hypothetical protein